ncbi:MAG: transporter [Hyphomicrobiales bacterium]|nr:transporter [Hyphomicrobiales bacterium]
METVLLDAKPAATVSEREKRMIIGGVLLTMLLAALEQTIVAPAMTTIAGALGRAEYLPWVVTAYLLAAIAMAPLYGKLSDIYGRRRVIFAGVAIFMVGSLICALAPNMFILIGGRAVQGLGGGGLLALTQIVIGDLVPPAERARYASWTSGTWAIACIAGPILGGIFAEHLHWSLIFWINIPLGLFALAITSAPLKKLPVVKRPHSLDWIGAGLLVGATTALLLALNWGGHEYPWLSWQLLAILVASLALWIAFGWRLLRAEEPFISLQILSNRIVLTAAFANLMLQGVLLGLSVFVPVYFQMQLGLTATQSSLGLLGMLMGTFAGSTLSGCAIPKMAHYRAVALFGCLVGGAALFVLAAQLDGASFGLALGLLICAGFGIGTGFPGRHRGCPECRRLCPSRRGDRRADVPAVAGRCARRCVARRGGLELRPEDWRNRNGAWRSAACEAVFGRLHVLRRDHDHRACLLSRDAGEAAAPDANLIREA